MISLVIPLYFSDLRLYQTIDACFQSLSSWPEVELIVIDDASPLELPEEWPVTHTNEANLGFTGTVNRGLATATGDIIVIANDDILFTRELYDRFAKIGYGIYSPKTSEEGAGDKFGSIWGLNRATLERMGLLDESLPHFFSDTDYYDRAKALGVPITKWYDLVITHKGSATYNLLADRGERYQADKETYEKRRNIY